MRVAYLIMITPFYFEFLNPCGLYFDPGASLSPEALKRLVENDIARVLLHSLVFESWYKKVGLSWEAYLKIGQIIFYYPDYIHIFIL